MMADHTYMANPIEGARRELRQWATTWGYDADAAITDFDILLDRGAHLDAALAIVHIKHVCGY